MLEGALFDLALIIVLGIAAQWIGWRLSIPSIVLLLVAGIVPIPDSRCGDAVSPADSTARVPAYTIP